jgi:gamma-glutamylcyclotransferase (GGCT)/AIG2-like uncharacterized protein YtfP
MPSPNVPPPALFVYGTLKRGQINDVLLQPYVEFVEPAWTHGTLYDLGDFPALTHGSGVVHGELVHVPVALLPKLLAVLDGLEGYREDDRAGSHYLRDVIDVWMEAGRQCRASAYFYNSANPHLPALDLFPALDDGVWPALTSQLEAIPQGLEEFRHHVAVYRHNIS